MSDTYLSREGIETIIRDNRVLVKEGDVQLFPSLPINFHDKFYSEIEEKYWASFPYMNINTSHRLLDEQFIYHPPAFLNMNGAIWQTFRKNSRKWKRERNFNYTFKVDNKKLEKLLIEWAENKGDGIEDPEFLVDCIVNPKKSDYIKYLYNDKKEMVGVNYADENYFYINYRFLICRKEPYLDEFMRYLLYTDKKIQSKQKKVNDGGFLGKESLKKFKLKLNPVRVDNIYTNI